MADHIEPGEAELPKAGEDHDAGAKESESAADAETTNDDGHNSNEPGNGDSSNPDPATSKDLAVGKSGSHGESEPGGDTSSGDQDGKQQTAMAHAGHDDAGQRDDAIQIGSLSDSSASGQPNGNPEQKPLIPYTRTDSGGLNFLSKDDLAGARASHNEGIPGVNDVIVHANPDQFFLSDNTSLSPSQMADAIRSAPDYHGGPVRLVACKAGALDDGAAQQVADSLNQPVIAATDTVWPLPDGTLVVGSNPSTQSGQWRTFNPRK
jgi:hypothetical protein